MSGSLLNGTKATAPSSSLSNQLLQQAEDKIESQLDLETKQNVAKIVVAGMHAGLSGGPQSILASLQKSTDPVSDAAKGAVSVVLILRKQAQGVMPLKAAVPAAAILMIKALAFADRAGIVKVGQPELVRATKIMTDFVLARFGISKAGLQNAAEKVNGFSQDPAAMNKIQMKAGTLIHPDAARPTPLPPA